MLYTLLYIFCLSIWVLSSKLGHHEKASIFLFLSLVNEHKSWNKSCKQRAVCTEMKDIKKEKMVHHHQQYHRVNHWRKGQALDEDEESQTLLVDCGSSGYYKRTRPKLVSLLLLSLFSCVFILAPHLFGSSSTFSLLCKLFSLIGFFYFVYFFFFYFWLCLACSWWKLFWVFFCRFTSRWKWRTFCWFKCKNSSSFFKL